MPRFHGFQVLLIILCLLPPTCFASLEYKVKAAFIYNFTKFIQWPKARMEKDQALTVCVLGKDPFGNTLEESLAATVSERDFQLIRMNKIEIKSISMCHILFVSESEKNRFHEIINKINGLPILTISDAPGFTSAGGMINFYLEDGKIRFEINVARAQKTGLKLSSKLLSLARIVIEP